MTAGRVSRLLLGVLLAVATAAPAPAQGAPRSEYYVWVSNFKDGTVALIDLSAGQGNGQVLWNLERTFYVGKKPRGLYGFTGDPQVAVAVEGTNEVVVVAQPEGVLLRIPVGRKPADVAINPDGEEEGQATLKAEKRIQWIGPEGAGDKTAVSSKPVGVAYSPDGARLAVACYGAGGIEMLDTADLGTARRARMVSTGSKPANVSFDQDGEFVFSGDSAGVLSRIDAATGLVTDRIDLGSQVWDARESPTGTNLAASLAKRGTVALLRGGGSDVVEVAVGSKPRGLAYTPDGRYVAVANFGENTVSIIEVATDSEVATISVGKRPWDVAVTPRERQ